MTKLQDKRPLQNYMIEEIIEITVKMKIGKYGF